MDGTSGGGDTGSADSAGLIGSHRMSLQHQPMHQLQQHQQSAWCAGCSGPITERFLLQAVDRCWHTRCLKCHHCGIPLSDLGSSCYSRSGMILCKNDYLRLFGSNGTCSGCSMHIAATEFVLRTAGNNSVYHVQCFICSQCHCPLQPGDRYALLNGQPVCEPDFAKAFSAAVAATAAATAPPPTQPATGGPGKRGGGKKRGAAGGGGAKQQQQQQQQQQAVQQQQQQATLQPVC